MNRVAVNFICADVSTLLKQLLQWADSFKYASYLNSNEYSNASYHKYDALIAVAQQKLAFTGTHRFTQLKKYYDEKDWLFGYLSYDLKNEVEQLTSSNPDYLQLPEIFFFQPEYVFEISKNELTIHSFHNDHDKIFNTISSIKIKEINNFITGAKLHHRTTKEVYLKNVNSIKEQIINGDFYELNYCQQFFCEDINIDPVSLYTHFNHISPAPFSAFIKLDKEFILSASPERFLKKENARLISQPIKGTRKRNLLDKTEDEKLIRELTESEKERAENLMIVDLVRNDLSRSAVAGSVKVEELCGIYSFPQVHQMISTISSILNPVVHPIDALKYCFPMGSMTGAPKIEVMKAIEHYEDVKRGTYSGAIGYFNPSGNFDFNVVIRSIIYNHTTSFLSYHAGSAITADADAMSEYEECLLKAMPIRQLIGDE